jgi:hypothetical protein
VTDEGLQGGSKSNVFSAGEKVSLSIRTILLKPVVILPHQSAPQTASPRGSLKTPQLRYFYADNTIIDFRER